MITKEEPNKTSFNTNHHEHVAGTWIERPQSISQVALWCLRWMLTAMNPSIPLHVEVLRLFRRPTHTHKNKKQTNKQANKQPNQTKPNQTKAKQSKAKQNKQTNKQANKQTDRQTCRQTGRQITITKTEHKTPSIKYNFYFGCQVKPFQGPLRDSKAAVQVPSLISTDSTCLGNDGKNRDPTNDKACRRELPLKTP